MTTDRKKISDDAVDEFHRSGEYAGELEGFTFVDEVETGEFDNHGGQLYTLVLKDSEGTLYGGEFALDPGEGEIYEFPGYLVPVERVEKVVTVVSYKPIG